MKIKDLTKEELETMGYDDIAFLILSESKTKITLPEIFKKICKLLQLDDKEYEDKISDFFQLMSTDHRFIMLPKGYWDLKTRHQTKVIIESDDDEEITPEDTVDDTDLNEPDEDENIFEDDEDADNDDSTDDDYKDLVIVNEDEEDEANTNM